MMIHPRATSTAKKLIEKLKITEAPVDVYQIAKASGIVISEAPTGDEDLSGLILRSDKKTLIGVNASHANTRKRFTIAHELGHFFLHEKREVFIDRQDNFSVRFRRKISVYDRKESEANFFAAELLMPEELVVNTFRKLYEAFKESAKKLERRHISIIIEHLADIFEVSKEAMGIRLENLKLI